MSNPSAVIPFPGRSFSRGRGCWNCKSFDIGPLVIQHYIARRTQEVKANPGALPHTPLPGDHVTASRLAGRLGISADEALARIIAARVTEGEGNRFKKFDAMIRNGELGMCAAGKSSGDFVENMYLCDHWSGVDGSSLATDGHPIDKLPEELRVELDGPDALK